MAYTNTHVVSLGGSILFDKDALDTAFIKSFADLVRARIAAGERFVMTVGGGKPCRQYQQGLRDLGRVDSETLDWMGVYTTRFNAQFVRLLLQDIAAPVVVEDPTVPLPEGALVLSGGWKPGWSTDYVAVLLAKNASAKRVVNISNVTHVYDKDPAKFPDAQKFEDLTWDTYQSFIPAEWSPGLNSPFDPVGAREAHASGIEVCMVGKNIDTIAHALLGDPFDGTRIHT